MENFIKNLKISNFKSIREAELECGRVNLFVGKPNVGKSNVLEALSLFCAPFGANQKFLSDFIRYEKLKNLYHFTNTEIPISVNSEIGGVAVFYNYKYESHEFYFGSQQAINSQIKEKLDRDSFRNKFKENKNGIATSVIDLSDIGAGTSYSLDNYTPVKKYTFDSKSKIDERERSFLLPPYGKNLFSVIETNKKMKEILPDIFDEYGFEFLIDTEKSAFYLLRKENRIGYTIPYSLISDTLQRIIFYYAAIYSNKDSVLLFEEPESQSFLPYVSDLAYYISQDERNQYFITTHSPHLLNKIVKEGEDVAVYITYYENYETKFKKLTEDDIAEMIDYGIDIFFNSKYFLDEPVSENIA